MLGTWNVYLGTEVRLHYLMWYYCTQCTAGWLIGVCRQETHSVFRYCCIIDRILIVYLDTAVL